LEVGIFVTSLVAIKMFFLLLDGHGGEGEDDIGSVVPGLLRCSREVWEFQHPLVEPKRRSGLAVAILGQRSNLA
jgi:hypothetical protein